MFDSTRILRIFRNGYIEKDYENLDRFYVENVNLNDSMRKSKKVTPKEMKTKKPTEIKP